MSLATVYIFGGILASSLLSLAGMLVFSIRKGFIERMMIFLISFSTGAMLGDVFLHMLPEMIEETGFLERSWFLILGGVLASFILEKFIHWHHCHVMPTKEHYHPVGTMSLIGDLLHNALDGMLIAGAFMIDPTVGFATLAAVIVHEIPQEISDYALLIYSGYGKKKAIMFNLLASLSAFLGAIFVLGFSTVLPNLSLYLLPVAAGNFLYIAGSDLIPELHKETGIRRSTLQLLWMVCGIAFMVALTWLE
jgi:zinc and cadmium transporter